MKVYWLWMLIFGCAQAGSCQSLKQPVYDFARLNDIPEIDSAMDISNLTPMGYNKLIDKMFVLDQKYRIKVMNGTPGKRNQHVRRPDSETGKYWRLMAVNDQSNQALFLRLLKRYKWPAQPGKDGSSVKAWYIAWHAHADRQGLFYPFLVEAVNSKLLDRKTLASFRESMY
ncbi:hypothetical protein MUK70_00570 [Dyadobacter chenwenxiniae]|uniref:Uncharacterized protein n=1 Tax=Dyadobacter chenwenxiniae TaxID=2906456 RepID=A0A9X1TGN3_9BACT|nr:hypothetical protein [Dyadobacter chenwenxiniae]MCF0063820.1 hypothetical protein [Dyadobacter chenwenxiniae]UON83496.1 hypothetical protein MUK70_00570 [Dyadobacter chenwenxiniae]